MCRVCILTDSTVQFTTPSFPGCELVSVLPLHVYLAGQDFPDYNDLKLSDLPVSVKGGLHPHLRPPTNYEVKQKIENLGQKFDHIILILQSAEINPVPTQTRAALRQVSTQAALHIIDSKSISVGLGLLVQMAAGAAHQGMPVEEILNKVRASIPHIYAVFCVHSLTYLYYSGQIDPAQAIIGEMLGLWPLLLLENGRLVPVQKARNTRHLVEALYEFISEFNSVKHMALLQGAPPFVHEARNLYERILQVFPTVPYSELTMSFPLAAILGPRTLGLVVMEKEDPDGHRSCHR